MLPSLRDRRGSLTTAPTPTTLNSLFIVSNRVIPFTIISIIATALCFSFAALNYIGSKKLIREEVSFSLSNCVDDICTLSKNLSLKKGRTLVYLNYDFLLTSYFIYAKGTSYADVFKKDSYNTDVSDCYPVATYKDYMHVMKKLKLTLKNPVVIKEISEGNGDKKISPCGLKATLFDHLGSLTVSQGAAVIPFNTKDIIKPKYNSYIRPGSEDILDVTNGRFFDWYMPQVPAFGTHLFFGIAEQDLVGQFDFTYDRSNVFFDRKLVPKVVLIQQSPGIWANFSNFTFAILLSIMGALIIITNLVYAYMRYKLQHVPSD